MLMLAAGWSNNPGSITTLIDAGADVYARDNNSRTALMRAAYYNDNPAIITTLIDAGADVNARDKDGKTAWDLIQEAMPTRD